MNHPLHNRKAAAILIAVMTVWIAVSPLAAGITLAQVPSKVVATIDLDIPKQLEKVKSKINTTLINAGVTVFYNALQKFTSRLAYDAANYIANGGKGQSALVYKKGFSGYMKDVGEDAAGEVLGSLSDLSFFRDAGIDLCAPPNPQQLLQLQLSIGAQFPGLQEGDFNNNIQPRCDFQQVVQNYRGLYTTLSNTEVYDYITDGISFGGSDLGVSLTILGHSNELIAQQVRNAEDDRKETGPFKNLEDIVSGNVRTPAEVVGAQFKQQVIEVPVGQESEARRGMIGNAFEAGAIQLGIYTASVFINTLSSKVLNKVMQKGLIQGLVDAFKGSNKKGNLGSPDAAFVKNAIDTRLANIDLREVNLLRNSEVEILSDLYSCPDEGRNIWNCAMDEALAQIVSGQGSEGNLTIEKAVEEELLKEDWRLIPITNAKENQDRLCYTYAYCAGNLSKLRAMRIIPVGFEFAANSPENIARCQGPSGCVTVKEVLAGFSQCNAQGERDAQNPWCKLVDSNWVLTSFPQQCRLTGYGDTLISSRTAPQRRDECRDIQTCLQRDEKGQCVGGYGYCVAEKTTYRFNSTECLERDASCRSYTTRAGQAVAYVRNTIDGSVCTADNVGCQGYFSELNQDGSWNTTGPKFYADKTLAACASGDSGCTKLLAAEVGGTALNVIQNSSFEVSNGTPLKLDGWTSGDASFSYANPALTDETATYNGSASYMATSATLSQRVTTVPGNIVTLSAQIRAQSAGAATVSITANTGASATDLASIYRSSGCTTAGEPSIAVPTFGTNWERIECSFVVPPGVTSTAIVITGSNTLVDAVQFEESEYATPFVDGINRSLPVVHMKVAPEELACQGLASDPVQCKSFAKVCKQIDAGCQEYSETSSTDKVPAILSKNDLCPQQCVGYAEFRKQASAFDLVKDVDDRFSDAADIAPSYFIPATAGQCKQEDVGCETFTNVEQAVQGGETAQSFSYLRACEKPDAQRTKSFYVWEGSADAGYQLRTFSLRASLAITPGESAVGPDVLLKRGTDGTVKEPTSCNENLWRTGTDPDCRQFYDKDGNVFYRYYSQTILSTDQCVALRISRSGQRDDCRNTGGNFTESTGECIYNAYLGESRTCQSTFAGCRAFKGVSAGNVQSVLTENFRTSRGAFSNGESSEESVIVGDRSLRLSSAASITAANYPNEKDALYRVSFWAKAPGAQPLAVQLRSLAGSNAGSEVGVVSVGADWQRYSLGLFSGPDAAIAQLEISLDSLTIGTRSVFIDEVRVERVQDTVYVVNNSWNTPIQCDTSYAGAPEPQAMLGCREYKDTFNNTVYAHRFTRLCKEEAIGCRAFVDTRNSDSAYAQTFTQADATPVQNINIAPREDYPSNTTVRPADRMLYLVYDTSKLCKPENASCRAFGKPNYTPDRLGLKDQPTTVYLKDDILKYGEALCKPSEEMCEEFDHQGAKEYFRAPAEKVCEYKEGVRLSSADFPDAAAGSALAGLPEGSYNGYFVQGSNTPCYPEILESGSTFGMAQRGDDAYTGWTALCPASQDSCTEFRDVNDTTDPNHSTGKPYFFLNNDSIDKKSCGGQIDPANGCVLLRDMADNTMRFNSKATAAAYASNGYNPTAPIDCVTNAGNEFCQGEVEVDWTSGYTPVPPLSVFTAAGCSVTGLADDLATPYGRMRCPNGPPKVTSMAQLTNDSNLIVKVNLDRDCAQWLGCRSSETVFDPATRNYKDVCIDLALCDKATGKPGDIFCANYVDRDNKVAEPVLSTGQFFDSAVYTSRQVGLGAKDYSGYALPNAFQISDTLTMRVGQEGLTPAFYPESASRFGQDYRLAAKVVMPSSRSVDGRCSVSAGVDPSSYFARPLDNDAIGLANPNLNLCGYTTAEGKQIVGFYNELECQGDRPFNCYLPVQSTTDSTNFEKLAEKFKLSDPKSDASLTAAFPPAECRSSPEADSPFGTSYVIEWDTAKSPPTPATIADGFENANICEFGQDCACTYKRVTYNSQAKFYSPNAQEVPPGICIGGQRDGQTCIPSSLNEGTVSEGEGASDVTSGIQAAQSAYSCGSNSQCVAYSKLEIIKGVFGQCLERDTTQFAGTDQSNRSCLTWNPNPVLFGDKDHFHYQPTAGYLPPQNSGQYYCTSYARKPTNIPLTFQHFRRYNSDGTVANDPMTYRDKFANECQSGFLAGLVSFILPLPGGLAETVGSAISIGSDATAGDCRGNDSRDRNEADVSFVNQFDGDGLPRYVGRMQRLDLDPIWVDKGKGGYRNVASKKTPYISIAGKADYPSYELCDYSDAYTVPEERGNSATSLRLVDAGDGYQETFYRIHSPLLMRDLGFTPTIDSIRTTLSDTTVSYFKIEPSPNGDVGRLACGYNAEWASNMPSVDYKDQTSLQAGEAAWRADVKAKLNPFLTRANEKEIKTETTNQWVSSECLQEAQPSRITGSKLPTNLREGVYTHLYQSRSGDDEVADPIDIEEFAGNCAFKVWEMNYQKPQNAGFNAFETNQSLAFIRKNPLGTDDQCASSGAPWFSIRAVFQSPMAGNNPEGTWTFVGFWTSACAGKSGGDHRYMYMTVDVGSADVCRELAEVKSSATRQDAAFTDRTWKQSGYRDPATGATYAETNAPFSSALNTGVAGIEPLFQNGGEQAGFSPINPPTFLRSGFRTYADMAVYPQDKYAYLSNMFARIYRVYQYHDAAVRSQDKVCIDGPFTGRNCNVGPSECSVNGVCDSARLTSADRVTTKACNFGPGAGLLCTNDAECKGFTALSVSGNAIQQIKNPCILATGWTEASNGRYNSSSETNLTTSQAALADAFVCGGINSYQTQCTRLTGTRGSDECLMIVPAISLSSAGQPLLAGCVANPENAGTKACQYATTNVTTNDQFIAAAQNNGITLESTGNNGLGPTRINGRFVSCTEHVNCGITKEMIENTQLCQSVTGNTSFGRCDGGIKEGAFCDKTVAFSCGVDPENRLYPSTLTNPTDAVCVPANSTAANAACRPASPIGDANSTDPNKDNNLCTHSVGYYPRLDLCPDPTNEYCGLVSYRIDSLGRQASLDPQSRFPLPTDVTMGHYTPTFLGLTGDRALDANFAYITYYTPRPPIVAAPDTRNCATPGSCEVAQTNAFNLSGQTSGPLNAGIGQFVASMRFYAWATHNQMPLKRIYIDWGDGQSTKVADTKLKNHKPYCNVQSECSDQVRASGLTCNADGDCPAGGGLCKPTGVCQDQPERNCSADAECNTAKHPGDRCVVRTMFGNSRDACEANYFDFQHVYVCTKAMIPSAPGEPAKLGSLPQCAVATLGHCSRNARLTCSSDAECVTQGSPGDSCIREIMAVPGGCGDYQTNSCYFTPRLQVMDNWGWCTGECRAEAANGVLTDSPSSKIRHTYGGCFAGANPDPEERQDSGSIKVNTSLGNQLLSPSDNQSSLNECAINDLPGTPDSGRSFIRPWVVYPGAVQIRPSN